MNTFKVIDPKGIHAGGKHFAQGEKVRLPDSAQLDAFLHFKQVEEAKEAEQSADEESADEDKPKKKEKQTKDS